MRMSVTELDSFIYYKGAESMSLDDLLRRLRKEEPATRKMEAGRALHSVLELATAGDMESAKCDGFTFEFQADCVIPSLPVRELKGEIQIITPSGLVTLVGVVDGLDGAVYDHKLTEKFDAERYSDSYQWRCYLMMFKARKFVYNVFEAKETDPDCWRITGFHQLPLYAYPGMDFDVRREVSELAGLIAEHLPQRLAA